MPLKKIFRFWFPLGCYSVMIFYASSLEGGPGGVSFSKIDKILHVIEYIPFGFLLSRAVTNTSERWGQRKVLLAVLLGSFIYGLSDEIHQYFVPFREMSMWDIGADILGGVLGGLFYCMVSKRKK